MQTNDLINACTRLVNDLEDVHPKLYIKFGEYVYVLYILPNAKGE